MYIFLPTSAFSSLIDNQHTTLPDFYRYNIPYTVYTETTTQFSGAR